MTGPCISLTPSSDTSCKYRLIVFISVEGDRIESVSYYTDGCLHTNACANTIARMAENITIKQAWDISPEAVVDYLKALPEAEFHCAKMAVGALQHALVNLVEMQRSSWKKLYR